MVSWTGKDGYSRGVKGVWGAMVLQNMMSQTFEGSISFLQRFENTNYVEKTSV